MRDIGDVRGTKAARQLFSRRGIDLTLADIQTMHGVVHIRGTLQRIPGSDFTDLKAEVANVARVLRQKPEVRDVVVDAIFRG